LVIGREEGVLIAVVVGVGNWKMPVVGSTRVTPTFEDGGASLVDYLDVMLGVDDSWFGIAEGGSADQGSGECWHDVALAGRWWEVCELELGAGEGACDGAIGSANLYAGGRGVAVADRGVLGEEDAGGSDVGYTGVVDWQIGWVGDGWAARQ
jgi:hypothetical protein